jgi:two-component system, cell cycle sensor histidine kinase and response regulator CckA
LMVIMCTGFSSAVDADEVMAAGVKAFALKPLAKRKIARLIRKVFDG